MIIRYIEHQIRVLAAPLALKRLERVRNGKVRPHFDVACFLETYIHTYTSSTEYNIHNQGVYVYVIQMSIGFIARDFIRLFISSFIYKYISNGNITSIFYVPSFSFSEKQERNRNRIRNEYSAKYVCEQIFSIYFYDFATIGYDVLRFKTPHIRFYSPRKQFSATIRISDAILNIVKVEHPTSNTVKMRRFHPCHIFCVTQILHSSSPFRIGTNLHVTDVI